MGWILKIGLFVIVMAVTAGFVITRIPELRQKAVEYINPAAKERRILGELDQTLSSIDNAISNASGASSNEEQDEKFQKARDLIAQAKGLQSELEETNNKKDGVISSNLIKLIDSVIDNTPYPADHLEITNELKAKICKEPVTNNTRD